MGLGGCDYFLTIVELGSSDVDKGFLLVKSNLGDG
jgi:hypothetical protein